MDIHPPEHPIRSLRDFVVQIFTITVGILIALGLEQAMTSWHDRALAAHARADFIAEIDSNRHDVQTLLAGEEAVESALLAWIGYFEARERHETPTPPPLGPLAARGFPDLSTSAWEAALATQAFAQLRFDETRALSVAYTEQHSFSDMTANAIGQWTGLGGYGNPATVPDPAYPEEARTLRVASAYARSLAIGAKSLLSDYDRAEAVLRRGQ